MRLPLERKYFFTDVMIIKWTTEIILGRKRFELSFILSVCVYLE